MCFFCGWGTFWPDFVPGRAISLGWGTFWPGFVPGVAISSCWGTLWPDFVPGVAIFLGWGTFWPGFVPGVAISYARGTFLPGFVPGGIILAEEAFPQRDYPLFAGTNPWLAISSSYQRSSSHTGEMSWPGLLIRKAMYVIGNPFFM